MHPESLICIDCIWKSLIPIDSGAGSIDFPLTRLVLEGFLLNYLKGSGARPPWRVPQNLPCFIELVLGTECLIPRTWYVILGTNYLVPSTWYQVLTKYLVPKYLVPSTWYQVFGTKYLLPIIWYQVFGSKYTKYLIPCTWHPVLGTKYMVPSAWY